MDRAGQAGERRWRLRDATAEAHHALDSAVGSFADRSGYAAYLLSNYRFRAAVEPALPALPGPWQPRRLLAALTADLHDLDLPRPHVSPLPPETGSALIGQLYVLEGAALGGQILRRRAATLGLGDDFGARHLSGTAQNWAAFLHRLDAAHPFDADEAAEGAIRAFRFASAAFAKEPT